MKIERTRFTQADGSINMGPKAGHQRFYRDALYSVLEHLRPTLCLEIGTYYGGSSAVFQEYFDKLCPEGKLVTCDVNKYTELNMPNVEQVLVYPHLTKSQMDRWHALDSNKMLPDAYTRDDIVESSHIYNIEILKPYGEFDFCFLDGDHTTLSAARDWIIADSVLKHPKYVLFDDSKEYEHDCAKWIDDMRTYEPQLYNFYDFDDWEVTVGASLIWGKNG